MNRRDKLITAAFCAAGGVVLAIVLLSAYVYERAI